MSDLVQLSPGRPSVFHMYRSMVGVGLLCGLLIVSVYELTLPRIERNKAEALERAIFQVLPAAETRRTFTLTDGGTFERLEGEGERGTLVHAGYDASGTFVGLAIEASGMGYADVIGVIYGYSFEQEAIVGIRVLESKETPGLGDRIETDPAFLENFKRLDVTLNADGRALSNPIVAVKSGKKEHPWQVDGITGATISSVAIADILDRSASYWVPKIRENLDDFRTGI